MKLLSEKDGLSLSAVFGAGLFIVLCIVLHTAPDRLIGAAFCHQLPSRSPAPDFPFCFRCTGLFSGIFWSILFSLLSERRGKLFEKKLIIGFAAAFLLFMADIINTTEYIPIRWYEEKEEIRFLSSFPLGFMLVQIMAVIWFHFFESLSPGRPLPAFLCLPCILITAAVSYLIVFSRSMFLLRCFGYFMAAGCLIFLLILYSILIKCIALLRNRSYTDRTVMTAALSIVLLHICILGGLHIRFFPSEIFQRIQ